MTPRKGDKVRVTYEAEWICTWTPDETFQGYVVAANGYQVQVPTGATVEPLEDLRPGDVFLAADGATVVLAGVSSGPKWIRAHGGRLADRHWFRDEEIARPLTLLVRDGRPVTP